MTESSVSSPFMKQLRSALPGAVVIKHHDASMIGLPDCSVTWSKRIVWLEFKLVVPPVRGTWHPVDVAEKAPTQHQMMCNLGQQAHAALYVFWVKKSQTVVAWDPLRGIELYRCATTPELVQWFRRWLPSL